MKKGILYYSHNNIDGTPLNDACRKSLLDSGLPITSVTHEPIDLGRNIVVNRPRALLSMLENIVQGLETMTEDYIFLAEHDCIYHPSHYDYESDHISCNINMWRFAPDGFYKHPSDRPCLSSFSGPRLQLLESMRFKLAQFRRRLNRFDPMVRAYPPFIFEPMRQDAKRYSSEIPSLDARHLRNSASGCVLRRWGVQKTLPHWGDIKSFYARMGIKDHCKSIPRRERQVLGRYRKFVVAGPQRSGTWITAKIISDIFCVEYIDEKDFGVHSIKKMESLIKDKDSFVVQCPALTHEVFGLPNDICIVVVKRDIPEILESEKRINWNKEWSGQEKEKFSGLGFDMTLPVCKIKYQFIEKKKDGRTVIIPYGAFSGHPMWRTKGCRSGFKYNQTE
jgi:hypothetical protein